ncbi:hypothetical protein GF376_04700 [Candidatus Peregrinibacteria bacterium]|nr:hypothetical protein [Candidatus Peregrinibacteria bacterium]
MNRIYRRRRRTNYLLPFLVLVSIGVLIILGFQIFGMIFSVSKGDAIYYVAEGRSKLLPFGYTEWENTYNGVKFKLGDSVKTLSNGKGVISFYDGTLVRLDENTEVTLVDIAKNGEDQQILLSLERGNIWINKPKQKVIRKTDFVINTEYANYSITGTVFAISKNDQRETLRVLKGEVEVDILEEDEGTIRSIDTITVGIGQQVDLDQAVMNAYFNREQPSVKRAMDSDFAESDWYVWNELEDESPTDFANSKTGSQYQVEENSDKNDSEETDQEVNLSELDSPEIIEPEELDIVSEDDDFEIEGIAAEGTKQIVVKYKNEESEDYTKTLIENFDSDTGRFSYQIALEEDNIDFGKNVYRFIGVDEMSFETSPVTITIDYIAENEESEADTINDASASLIAPTVSTVGGENYSEDMVITDSSIVISGNVKGASSVYVNDYRLTRFSAGDNDWSYNASTAIGNLVPGENTFEIYATSEDGQKSAIETVTINYEPSTVSVVEDTVDNDEVVETSSENTNEAEESVVTDEQTVEAEESVVTDEQTVDDSNVKEEEGAEEIPQGF